MEYLRVVEMLLTDNKKVYNVSKMDINKVRVKQWVPNNHPNAPKGTLQKVKFENSLPGSKGYKRTPTQNELNYLNKLKP